MTGDPLRTEDDHTAYLRVALFSAGVMPEDCYHQLALRHLRHNRLTCRLKAMKEHILQDAHAYRLELRGKPYLCRLRLSGVTDNQGRPAMVAYDVVTLLEKVASLVQEPPKAKGSYYD